MNENQSCTFKEYLLDVIKIVIESYRQIFHEMKKKPREVAEVCAFIGKAIWNNKKQAIQVLAIQLPFLSIYFIVRHLRSNIVALIAAMAGAITFSIILQLYYYYLQDNKKRLLEEKTNSF